MSGLVYRGGVDRRRTTAASLALAALLALGSGATAPGVAAAQTANAAADDGERRAPRRSRQRKPRRAPRHVHEGPQFRFSLGAGGIYAYQSLDGGESEISGGGLQYNIAVGEMVTESLALNLDLTIFHASEAESTLFESVAFTAVNVGVGVTYWVMPQNVYLSAAIGMASSSVEEGAYRFLDVEIADVDTTGVGAGLHLSVGKLWWMSQRSGFGVTGSVLAMEMPYGEGDNIGPRLVISGVVALTLSYR